ncbi:TPM domain-containing protein [Phenylobacterium terrae]|uniref:TPM domain-containing protein n=2 Tax=Phenylobacterium terrae TaxID=2665495 RepID=A0ABW4MYN6_9CAUL
MSLAGTARGAVLAALILLLGAAAALAAPKFPPLTGRVVDQAGILSAPTEAQLTAELAQLEQQTGRQMVVATISDLGGYPIEDYGYQLGRAWGIGQKGEDDGVLFIVAPDDRQVRFEVGYGLEPVFTDTLAFLILQERVLPRFKAGEMEEGVVAGTQAAIAQLSLPEGEAKARVAAAAQARAAETDDGGGVPVFLFILFIFFVLSMLGGGRRRRRGLWWLWPIIFSGGGRGGGWSSGGGGWSSGGGGFSGGGGSFGGGGASGRW